MSRFLYFYPMAGMKERLAGMIWSLFETVPPMDPYDVVVISTRDRFDSNYHLLISIVPGR